MYLPCCIRVLGGAAGVVEGARPQSVLRRERQRVDPVPMPLEAAYELALLHRQCHKHHLSDKPNVNELCAS